MPRFMSSVVDTARALEELRHGIAHVLLDTIEKMSLDTWTVAHTLDRRPTVARNLLSQDTEDLTTEKMIECLQMLVVDQLRPAAIVCDTIELESVVGAVSP